MYAIKAVVDNRTTKVSRFMRTNNLVIGFVFALVLFVWILSFRGQGGPRGLLRYSLSNEDPTKMNQVSIRRLMCVAVEAAVRGGHEVRMVQESAQLHAKSKGGVKNPVTDGDTRSHRVMMGTLKSAFPNVEIVSEEHQVAGFDSNVPQVSDECQKEVFGAFSAEESIESDKLTVWIDPLDATQEYTENLLQYVTTLVGIAVNGRAVGGVIYVPFDKTLYWAWEGKAQSSSLKKDYVTTKDGTLRLIVSRSHAGPVKSFSEEALKGKDYEVVPAGGAGYKGLQVLLGKADAYVHVTKIKKWDLCAPNGILNAVGGKLSTLLGKEINYGDPRTDGEEIIPDGFVASVKKHDFFYEKFHDVKLKRK